jgi:rhodanese-related sulfurtransferase
VGRRIDAEVAVRLVAEGALVLDVRRHEDRPGPLEAAVRISPDEIPGRIGEFRRGVPIVLVCT